MKNDDRVLDKIVAHLRSEPVPEMPVELVANRTVKPRDKVWYAVASSVLAASIVGFLLWGSHASQTPDSRTPRVAQLPHTNFRESAVIVQAVDLAEPLAQLEARLALIDAEIAKLRRQAALLDVQRIADELLAQY